MSVITNSLAMMDTSSAVTSLNADAVVYDNTTSGLTATDAQAAIDELDSTIDTISTEIGSLDATDVGYTKTISGRAPGWPPIAITNVQEAFDYILRDELGAYPVPSDIVNYTDSSGFLFYNTNSVDAALRKVDNVLSDFLENTGSGEYVLPAENIVLSSASQTGIYANADDVQDALDAIKTALDSGGGGGGSSTAADVSFTKPQDSIYGSNTDNVQEALEDINTTIQGLNANNISFDADGSSDWHGSCAGDVYTALLDLDERVEALSEGGGGGSSTAENVSYTKPSVPYGETSIYGANTDTVKEALDDIDTVFRELVSYAGNEYFIPSDCINYGPCYGILINHNISTVSGALNYISTYLADGATNIAYTKPQSSIYGSNTDTVKEALDDVSTVIQALDSTDIAIPAASKTGIYANTATVQAALDAIKTAISSGGGGGSSSASSVSFTKPQGGIYESSTDTVQEALEDVSAKVLGLAASDIVYVNGCGGSYPTEVETVHDALECLQYLLLKYSEFEAETGWLWFNDKPIYQVSVEVESGTTNLFDTNELEIDDLVYMEATLTDSSGTKRWTISGSSGELYWNTATHMIVYGGSDVVTTATIRYTKTSD